MGQINIKKSAEHLYTLGKYAESIVLLKKIVNGDNVSDADLLLLGKCYIRTNSFDTALETLQRTNNSNINAELLFNKGLCYFHLQNFEKAISFFERTLKVDRNFPQIHELLKESIKLRKNRYGYFNPEKAEQYRNRGDQFMLFNDYPKAELNYKEAVKLDPDNIEYSNLLDEVLKAQKKEPIFKREKQPESNIKIEQERKEAYNPIEKLHELIGLKNIKYEINLLLNFLNIERIRKERGILNNELMLHMVFKGPPGTGKTTVARLLGEMLKKMGLLSKGHLVEVSRNDLVSEYMGQTAIKTNNCIDSAIDGILFIDEAYSLNSDTSGDYGKEAINVILKRMEDDRNRLVVIIAGYTEEIEAFLNSNPGLKSRFSRYFTFNDYIPAELLEIFQYMANANNFVLTPETAELLVKYFEDIYETRDKTFGNARLVRNVFEQLIVIQSNRLSKCEIIEDRDLQMILDKDIITFKKKYLPPSALSLEAILKEIDSLIGLEAVKKEIRSLLKFLKVETLRQEHGLQQTKLTMHFVFYGPPGTGKTTLARLLGQLFRALGILKKGHVIEADRSKLVGEFVGQTAVKTNNLIDSALDGILFIDEAYTLSKAGGLTNDYGQEAIDTLLKRMEDDRQRIIVIVAGYTELMKSFVNSNPGIKSRFTKYIHFNNYSISELIEIFYHLSKQKGYSVLPALSKKLEHYFEKVISYDNENNGNGRLVRNLFDHIVQAHASRIADIEELTPEQLITLSDEDLDVNSLELSINN